MDLDRLSKGEELIAASGILLFAISFIPFWAGIDYPAGTLPDENVAAWGGYPYFVRLALLFGLVNAIFVIVKASGLNLILPAAPGVVYLGLAGATTAILLAYVVIGPPVGGQDLARLLGLRATRGILLYAGFGLALLQTYGGWLHVRTGRSNAVPSTAT